MSDLQLCHRRGNPEIKQKATENQFHTHVVFTGHHTLEESSSNAAQETEFVGAAQFWRFVSSIMELTDT